MFKSQLYKYNLQQGCDVQGMYRVKLSKFIVKLSARNTREHARFDVLIYFAVEAWILRKVYERLKCCGTRHRVGW